MNPKLFIKEIIKLYRKARISKFPDKKIRRGRSHTIASEVEDLFAYYLVNNIVLEKVFIDQSISVLGKKGVTYPDLVIIKNGQITGFIDLKMDLGWHRDSLYELCEIKNKWLLSAQGQKCKLRDGLNKIASFYEISKNATFNVVLISDANANKDKVKAQILKSKKFNPDVEVFVLSTGKHPNTYGISVEELLNKKIHVNDKNDEDEFKRLTEKIAGY